MLGSASRFQLSRLELRSKTVARVFRCSMSARRLEATDEPSRKKPRVGPSPQELPNLVTQHGADRATDEELDAPNTKLIGGPRLKQATLPFQPSATDTSPGQSQDPLGLEKETMQKDWFDRLEGEMRKDTFVKVSTRLYEVPRGGN